LTDEVVKLEEQARSSTWPLVRAVTKTALLLLESSRAPAPKVPSRARIKVGATSLDEVKALGDAKL
jgi:hypothetical protein